MLKKTITYNLPDLDDPGKSLEVTEEFYFNLTQAEAIEINIVEDLERVYASQNPRRILQTFKRIIQASYGERQGMKIVKNEDSAGTFLASEAYSKLAEEILFTPGAEQKMADFVRAILPTDWDAQKAKLNQPQLPAEGEN